MKRSSKVSIFVENIVSVQAGNWKRYEQFGFDLRVTFFFVFVSASTPPLTHWGGPFTLITVGDPCAPGPMGLLVQRRAWAGEWGRAVTGGEGACGCQTQEDDGFFS